MYEAAATEEHNGDTGEYKQVHEMATEQCYSEESIRENTELVMSGCETDRGDREWVMGENGLSEIHGHVQAITI